MKLKKFRSEKNEIEALEEEIEETIADLRECWHKFPEKWTREDLHGLCQEVRHVWRMLDELVGLETAERQEAARQEAVKILASGCEFDKITIAGFEFVADGLEVHNQIDYFNRGPFDDI